MNLQEALEGISVHKYYDLCGYSYMQLREFGELPYRELNPSMQKGITELIKGIYRVQKMVYSYELSFVCHCMKDCGIKYSGILERCNLKRPSRTKVTEDKLIALRIELMEILVRLLTYATQ